MIDDFTAEYRGDAAPVDAVRDRIGHLEALGVNAVEPMPWTARPGGSFSWATTRSRCSPSRTALHRRGIHVVMDGVFNHIESSRRPDGQLIGDACRFWLDEYRLDGIRLDYTLGFHRPGDPGRGLGRLLADLRAHLAAAGREHVTLTLEHMSDNRFEAIDVANTVAADGCWHDRFLWTCPRRPAGG